MDHLDPKFTDSRWANWCRFAPVAVLLSEHGGILCRTVLYESLNVENCASAQEIGENAPVGGTQLARI